MGSSEAASPPLSVSSSALPSTPRSAIRPLSASYRSSGSDYQVSAAQVTLSRSGGAAVNAFPPPSGGGGQTDAQERRQPGFQSHGVRLWLVTRGRPDGGGGFYFFFNVFVSINLVF